MHAGVLLSLNKKNKAAPFSATWMGLEVIILTENKPEKEKYHTILLIYGISKKKKINLPFLCVCVLVAHHVQLFATFLINTYPVLSGFLLP